MRLAPEAQCLLGGAPGAGPCTCLSSAWSAPAGLRGAGVWNLGSEGGRRCGLRGVGRLYGCGRCSPRAHESGLLSHEVPVKIPGTFAAFFFLKLPESRISPQGRLFAFCQESTLIAQMGLLGVACLLPLDKLVCQGGLGGFSLVSEVDYFCLCMGHICGQAIHSSNHLSMHHPSVCLSIHPPTQLPIHPSN